MQRAQRGLHRHAHPTDDPTVKHRQQQQYLGPCPQRRRQRQRHDIPELAVQPASLGRGQARTTKLQKKRAGYGLAYIVYMRFVRHTGGVEASRAVLGRQERARGSGHSSGETNVNPPTQQSIPTTCEDSNNRRMDSARHIRRACGTTNFA